ncbi:MAG: P-II family nitrogen regulator [Caldisericaceae bacterium]
MAYLLVVVLNKTEKLNKILSRFLEVDVRGATIIDSIGMGRTLQPEIATFSALLEVFNVGQGRYPENRTIFTVIKEEKTLRDAQKVVREELNDFKEPGTGIMFVVPVSDFIGLAPSLEEEEQAFKNHKNIEKQTGQ